jgi:hypothetical protein
VSSAEFVKSRTDVVEMNGLRMALGDRVDHGRMDEPFTVDRVKARLDALGALGDYGTLLHTLVTSSQQEELQRASDSFVASMRKVKGVTMTDEKAAAISAAVEKVGGLLIEYMRARAVREVVTAADPAVLLVVTLVKQDFDPAGGNWSLGYSQTTVALTGAATLAARRDGTRDAALIDQAGVLVRRNDARFAAVAEHVGQAADALRQAEGNLLQAVDSRDVSTADIETFAGQVQDFVRIYTILRDK